ncbi:MAG TPA: polysaccharide deacetylase family protein [Solirubrobacteraceae bacterium]
MSITAPVGFTPRQLGHPGNVTRALSLTFDDGPDETWTPLILEQLKRCEATAMFFMVGERVLADPALTRRVIAAGHDVQLHCHRHVRHTELTERELQLDTELALTALAGVGVRPRLWRAPWGVATEASRRVAERMGLRLVHWSIDTHDWRGDSPQRMLAHARPRLADRATVLMHDALGPGARRPGCQNTLALLPALTAATRAQGLKLVPMLPYSSPTASGRPTGAQA